MKKCIFNCGSGSAASGKGLKRDLLAALIGVLVAWPALAAGQEMDNEAQAETAASTFCATCHGGYGNSVTSTFPKRAGMTSGYFVAHLTEFMTGKRRRACLRQQHDTA